MEINEMNMEQVEARMSEIKELLTAEDADIEALSAETDKLLERKAAIKAAAEEKRSLLQKVAASDVTPIEKHEEKEERKTMTSKEIRSTKKYVDAYVDYIKGKNDGEECRALLTEGADVEGASGPVPVPTYVEGRIETAWENDEIMSRVKKTFLKGNVKVGVEMYATGAAIHREGEQEPPEERLILALVDIIAISVKKWITVSTEVMDLNGEAFLDYIYDEIVYQIVKFTAAGVLENIANAPTSGTTAPTVATMNITTPALSDIINAIGQLSGAARDIVFIASRQTIAQYQALALGANYAADIFAGATVIANDMPDGVAAIVGDLSAVQVNYPAGDEVKFIFDEMSLAEKDLVKIVGRQMAGFGLVRNRAFTVMFTA
jgi:HK97 family phage major capsid protein